MDKNYRLIMLKMDYIIEQLYEIGTLAESTSYFPVRSYVNLQDSWQNLYQDLRGASKKASDLNYKFAKAALGSIYGMSVTAYADTDSIKRRVDSDGHQD